MRSRADDGDPTNNIGIDDITVLVANLAPAVTAAADQTADEGTAASFDLGSFTDPGDDDPWTVIVAWGDGNTDTFADSETTDGDIIDRSHTYADDGTYTVTVTVRETGGPGAPQGAASFDIVVANLAPAVTAAADQTADEGTSASFDLGSFTDPGDDDPWTVIVAWGDGNTDTFADSETTDGDIIDRSHTYADDGTYTVTVTVRETGGPGAPQGAASFDIVVANLAPAVTAAADQTADEGTAASFDLGSFTDPGDDDPWTVIVAWGDGNTDTFADSETTDGDIIDRSHTYADDGTYTVTVTVRETGGPGAPQGAASFDIVVANVNPIVTLSGPASSNEGQTQTYSFSWTDPGSDTWSRTASCGAGGVVALGSFNQSAKTGSFTCTWADDVPTASPFNDVTVNVIVMDDDGGSDNDSKTVRIHNLAPAITFADAIFNQPTGVVTSTISYADAGVPDTETVTFQYNWTGTTSGSDTNIYPGASTDSFVDIVDFAPGCYTIQVAMYVTDDDTGSSSYAETIGPNVDFYSALFLPPIKDNERNIAKYGNVVPIKVELRSMCFPGTTVTSPNLHITVVSGDQTGNDLIGDEVIATSVSNADSGTQMRVQSGGYMYNFSTKSLTQGKEYTIRIRDGSTTGPIILRALFLPKK